MDETGYELAPYDTAVISPQDTASSPAVQTGRQFDVVNISHLVPSQPQTSDVFKLNANHHVTSDYDITPAEYRGTEEFSRVPLQKVELDKAEHPWMRPSKVEGDLSEEERETERLFRKLQGILNKLTPQRFQTLAEQALRLKIDSQQKLIGCADRIIANAVKGSKYCIAYANLCKVMSTIKVESTREDDGRRVRVITFRRVLLSKVQQEFEKDKKDDEEREGLLMAIEAAQDPERKQQLRDRVKDLDAKNLKWSLGIVHFIGELFKLKMLSETVIHECLVRLLRSSSDTDSLECFARLLTVTGKDIDRPEAKSWIDQHFSRISKIIKKGRIPLRIKFILQDVQELRANKWIPLRIHQDYSLKTVSQVHEEARIEEEKEKQLVAEFIARSMKHGRVRNRTNRQDYLSSSDWHYGREGRNREREAKGKLQDARKLQLLLKHEKLPVELHRANIPWKRPKKLEEDLSGEKELFRKFQGILNKLTPQKFQTLAEQALMLKINSELRLKGCIDQIFNVALKDPKYSIAYSNLCKVMSTLKVETPTEEGKVKVITFRRMLLTRVQQKFESKEGDEEKESMLNTIKEAHDPAKKRQLEQELEIFEAESNKQSMNNIRFLGELFKLKMLSETIMHECIVRLLRSSSDEHSLEMCAILITTTGKDLDHPDAKTRVDQYFSRISEIIIKGKIPLRIKFMLQDVHDLRTNNWISHQVQEDSLKTIDWIHHEAKIEED